VKLFFWCQTGRGGDGHIRDARAVILAGRNVGFLRRKFFNFVGSFSLRMADCVKILNLEQFEEWQSILSNKKWSCSDFVPTSQFNLSERDDSFLYCLGYRFI
jgi:hypothetical protein